MAKKGFKISQEIKRETINRIKNNGISEYSPIQQVTERESTTQGDYRRTYEYGSKKGVATKLAMNDTCIGIKRTHQYYVPKQPLKDWKTKDSIFSNLLLFETL